MQKENIVEIPSLGGEDVEAFLAEKLIGMGRKITVEQMDAVSTANFKNSKINPFCVNLLAHELKSWTHEKSPSANDNAFILSASVSPASLVERVLKKLEQKHGELIFRACLSYIALAKEGLTSNELLDVLSLDNR